MSWSRPVLGRSEAPLIPRRPQIARALCSSSASAKVIYIYIYIYMYIRVYTYVYTLILLLLLLYARTYPTIYNNMYYRWFEVASAEALASVKVDVAVLV